MTHKTRRQFESLSQAAERIRLSTAHAPPQDRRR